MLSFCIDVSYSYVIVKITDFLEKSEDATAVHKQEVENLFSFLIFMGGSPLNCFEPFYFLRGESSIVLLWSFSKP
jgi:hypothetical protein